MGYDLTFHTVRLDREGALLRAVLERQLAPDAVPERLPRMSEDLVPVVRDILQGMLNLVDEGCAEVTGRVSYALGMLGGFFEPCWYTRGLGGVNAWQALHPALRPLLVPATRWLGGPLVDVPDPTAGAINQNFCGGGVISDLAALAAWRDSISDPDAELGEGRDTGWDGFCFALDHAVEHGLALVEVTDLYVPSMGAAIPAKQVRHT